LRDWEVSKAVGPGEGLAIDRLGLSAPGPTVMKELGMTKEHVVAAAEAL
jgi:transketolase